MDQCPRCETCHLEPDVEKALRDLEAGRLSNPVWLDKSISKGWSTIDKGPARPKVRKIKKLLHAKPYGCGTWGCVVPTEDPAIVLKITSDPREAWFVSKMLQMQRANQEPGLVRYYDIARLPGERQGEPIFALWRESAFEVGEVEPTRKERSTFELFSFRLDRLFELADSLDDIIRATAKRDVLGALKQAEALASAPGSEAALTTSIDAPVEEVVAPAFSSRSGKRTPRPLEMASYLSAAKVVAKRMASPRLAGHLVGRTMLNLMTKRGIVLADVRDTNIGRVNRGRERGLIVITDPGMAVPLREHVSTPKV